MRGHIDRSGLLTHIWAEEGYLTHMAEQLKEELPSAEYDAAQALVEQGYEREFKRWWERSPRVTREQVRRELREQSMRGLSPDTIFRNGCMKNLDRLTYDDKYNRNRSAPYAERFPKTDADRRRNAEMDPEVGQFVNGGLWQPNPDFKGGWRD